MKLGVRGKLFALTVTVAVVALAGGGLYLQHALRASLEGRIEAQLFELARSGRVLLQTLEPSMTIEDMDRLADDLGAESDVRVTVVAADGRVLGDSRVDTEAIAAVENHGSRPEVLEARGQGTGSAMRRSSTTGVATVYVAVPFDHPRPGVLRFARPLADVDAAVSRMRRLLLGGGLVALIAVLLATALVSHWFGRTLRELLATAQAIAAGDAARRVEVRSGDEIGGLAGSLNRMAEDLGRTLAELSAERARLAAVLDGMGEALVALDDERRIALLNPAAERLLSVEGARGRSLVEVLRAPALLDHLDAADEEPFELELTPPGGAARRLRVRASRPEGGGWVVVMHDITALRRLETVRRDFVANVSHELRTPVSVVSANAETLLAGALDDREHAPRLVEAIQRNAARLSTLIADLLDLSRLEAGRQRLEREVVAVRGVADRVAESLAQRARERDTEVLVEVDADVVVRADGEALQQILQNYVENAIKYAPGRSRVVVGAERRDERVRIAVRDDGPGLEPRHRERVFERFYRVDPGRSRAMGGTGLGLSIVKHLAETMGGAVGVDPVEPRGSLFWVELPAG